MPFRLKRVYEEPEAGDGYRVLVERLWPRGVSREKAALDEWCKDVAPSSELRRWFGHDPGRWGEFLERYRRELRGSPAVDALLERGRKGVVTLLYSSRDEEHNNAVALRDKLERALRRRR